MALIVHKYGGTSMGSVERIRNVAQRVAIVRALAEKERSMKELSKELADRFHVSRKQVYERALELKPDEGCDDV